MTIPLKAVVEITKLQHYLIILSSFILFFSLITVFETGLDRYNLVMGAIFFFSSSMVFWLCSIATEYGSEDKIEGSTFVLACGLVLLIVWIALLIISFYFFVSAVKTV